MITYPPFNFVRSCLSQYSQYYTLVLCQMSWSICRFDADVASLKTNIRYNADRFSVGEHFCIFWFVISLLTLNWLNYQRLVNTFAIITVTQMNVFFSCSRVIVINMLKGLRLWLTWLRRNTSFPAQKIIYQNK